MGDSFHSNGDGTNRSNVDRLSGERSHARENSVLDFGLSVESSLRDVCRILIRQRRKALGVFAAILALAGLYTIVTPRQYRSDAKLFVRLGRENVGLDATTTLGQGPSPLTIPLSREEEINSVVEVLESRTLLEKVVESLGVSAILNPPKSLADLTPPDDKTKQLESEVAARGLLEHLGLVPATSPLERAVNVLQKQLWVEAVKKTNVIHIWHEGPSPQISQQIVARLIDFYLDEHARMNRTPRAVQFLGEQAAAEKAQLTHLEDELRKHKNATGLISPAEQRQSLVLQIGKLEDELKTAQSSAIAAEAEIKEINNRLANLSPTQVTGLSAGYPNVAADGMRQQLYALQLKEKDLASRATDENVELKFVRDQIASARQVFDSLEPSRTQTTTGPNHTYEELQLALLKQQGNLASLRAKASAITAQLVASRREFEKLNDGEVKIAQLQRDIQLLDTNYRKYADSLEQARIDASLERERISNINVAQPPAVSHQPVFPKPMVILSLGLVLGLLGGLVVALGSEYFDHSLKSAEEVEQRLQLPVLGSIPKVEWPSYASI